VLNLRLNDLKNSSLERRVSAQVLCLETDHETFYISGLVYINGKTLGVLIHHTGGEIKRWAKTDYIWNHFRKLAGTKLANMNVISVNPDNAELIEIFIATFKMNTKVVNKSLDNSRRQTLNILTKALKSETARDTPNT